MCVYIYIYLHMHTILYNCVYLTPQAQCRLSFSLSCLKCGRLKSLNSEIFPDLEVPLEIQFCVSWTISWGRAQLSTSVRGHPRAELKLLQPILFWKISVACLRPYSARNCLKSLCRPRFVLGRPFGGTLCSILCISQLTIRGRIHHWTVEDTKCCKNAHFCADLWGGETLSRQKKRRGSDAWIHHWSYFMCVTVGNVSPKGVWGNLGCDLLCAFSGGSLDAPRALGRPQIQRTNRRPSSGMPGPCLADCIVWPFDLAVLLLW